MEPAENYPFPRDAAVLHLTLTGKAGPAAGETLWAAAAGAVSVRLAQSPVKENAEARLICRGPAQLLSIPGWFLAADEGKAGPELVHLREIRGETGVLDVPMAKEHPRGTQLLRARCFVTNGAGKLEAAFRGAEKLYLLRKDRWKTVDLKTGVQELEWKEG